MDFVTVRDLRLHPNRVWQALDRAHEIIVTLKGRPIGILAKAASEDVEQVLRAFRQVRAAQAIFQLRADAARSGSDRMSSLQIQKEIVAVRRGRKSSE